MTISSRHHDIWPSQARLSSTGVSQWDDAEGQRPALSHLRDSGAASLALSNALRSSRAGRWTMGTPQQTSPSSGFWAAGSAASRSAAGT